MYSTRRQRSLPLCFKFCGFAISIISLPYRYCSHINPCILHINVIASNLAMPQPLATNLQILPSLFFPVPVSRPTLSNRLLRRPPSPFPSLPIDIGSPFHRPLHYLFLRPNLDSVQPKSLLSDGEGGHGREGGRVGGGEVLSCLLKETEKKGLFKELKDSVVVYHEEDKHNRVRTRAARRFVGTDRARSPAR